MSTKRAVSTELSTLDGLSKQCWLTQSEQPRFRSLCLAWKSENPKANIVQQMLFESLIRVHLFEQRLIDKRVFWDGSPTDYRALDGRRTGDLGDEDAQIKAKEFATWYPQVIRWKESLLKIALASKIEITSTDFDLAEIVKQYQETHGEGISRNGHRSIGN